MDAARRSRGEVFARGVATLLAWQALPVVAAVVGWFRQSTARPGPDCQDEGLGLNCAMSDREGYGLMLAFGALPAMMVAFIAGVLLVGALAALRLRSGFLAGALAAVPAWAIGYAVIFLR